MRLICAIFLIFIAFCKGDNGKVEADLEDAEEILPNRRYYWKNWRFCQDNGYLHVWSEAVALRFIYYTYGCFEFITDYKLRSMCWDLNKLYYYSDSDYQNRLQTFKRMNTSTTQAQPILSHAGSTKLVFGEWFLVSRNEGEISIQNEDEPLVITIREDIRSFTVESEATNQTFTAKTLLGAEFSTSWIPGQKINQSSLRAEAVKSLTEQQSKLASCSILNKSNSDNGWTEIRCHNRAHLHNISYVWDFDRFDLHRPADNANKIIRSPSFSSATYDKIKWFLKITPGNDSSDEISIFLCRCPNSTESRTWAQMNIDFLDSKGNLMHALRDTWFKTYSAETTECWGWYEIPIKKVVSSDNSLNIVCKIAVCDFTTNTIHLNRTDTSLNSGNNLSQNLVQLSTKNNSENSNVTLVLSKTGKEYSANKAVLAASSPVFANMFDINCTGKGEKIDRVNITDVDSEQVMDELLKYIETSKCENIETLAQDLLIAAHKYELHHLKELCVEKITDNLTWGNAVDILNLAHKHDFRKLKSNTIRFMANVSHNFL